MEVEIFIYEKFVEQGGRNDIFGFVTTKVPFFQKKMTTQNIIKK